MAEFHYVWNDRIDPEYVREKYSELAFGSFPVLIQWTGGKGGSLEWSLSEAGLQRWKIIAYDIQVLEAIERLLRDAFGPIAKHEVKLHPVYQEGDHLVGWVFWKRKG